MKSGEDGKMPTLKNDLHEMWKNLKHREVGMFVDFDESTSAGAVAEPVLFRRVTTQHPTQIIKQPTVCTYVAKHVDNNNPPSKN